MSRFRHSHSAHEAHGECPARFWLGQTGAKRDAEANNYRFGRTFHLFAKLYRDHCIEEKRWSDIEATPALLAEAMTGTGIASRHYEELAILCSRFVANEPIDIERSLGRETGIALDADLDRLPWRPEFEYDSPTFAHSFAPNAGADLTCQVCGEIDASSIHRLHFRMQLDEVLVDAPQKMIVIDDWKTDFHAPSESEINNPEGRWWSQARTYAWGALAFLYPLALLVEFRFKFVRWGITRTVLLTREDIESFARRLIGKVAFIESQQEFPAIPGAHCRTCPYLRSACPIAADNAAYATPIEGLAAHYLYTAAAQEAARDELKQWASTEGQIYIAGVPVAIFNKSEGVALDIEKLLAFLTAEGIERPELLLDISKTKLQRNLPALAEAAIKAAGEKTEDCTVFNLHQNKPELVALARERGVPEPEKMKVAALVLAIVMAASGREAA